MAIGTVIRIQGISLSLGAPPRLVIDNLSMHVHESEIVGLVGPSGCGKTTLLRCVMRFEVPELGAIKAPHRPQTRMTFQRPPLQPWHTAREHLIEAGNYVGKDVNAIAELSRVGLQDAGELFPKEMSGGMRQRLELARAICTHPKALLLDEPFAGVDEPTRNVLGRIIKSLSHEEHVGVLFVTHSVDDAVRLCRRVYVVSQRPAKLLAEIDCNSHPPQLVAARIRDLLSEPRAHV